MAAFAASDTLFPQQWALAKIQAEQAWSASKGGATVAVVDTGVDFAHPDLAGKSVGSFDCTQDPCAPVPDGDVNGHGTEVSGIIAAHANNAQGIAPVAPDARILSVRVLDGSGAGPLTDVVRGIEFAGGRASVINLSLGPEVNVSLICSVLSLLGVCDPNEARQEFQQAINDAAGKGSLVIAAAGNDQLRSFYDGMQNVEIVGATGPDDEPSFYSSTGANIYAPGGDARGGCNSPTNCVLTTGRGGGYVAVQGTSFAAPHASGVGALLMARGQSPTGAIAAMNSSTDPGPPGGRLNAAKALNAAGALPQAASQPEAGPQNTGTAPNPAAGVIGALLPKSILPPPGAPPAPPALAAPPPQPPPAESGPALQLASPPGASSRGKLHAFPAMRRVKDNKSRAPVAVASLLAAVTALGGGAYFWKLRRPV